MAKSVEVTAETIAAKLKTQSIPDAIKWAINNGGKESPVSDQLAALEAARDKMAEGKQKTAIMAAIDQLTTVETETNRDVYDLIGEAIRTVAGSLIFPKDEPKRRGRKAGGGSGGSATVDATEADGKAVYDALSGGKSVATNDLSPLIAKGAKVGDAIKTWNVNNPEKEIVRDPTSKAGRGAKYKRK